MSNWVSPIDDAGDGWALKHQARDDDTDTYSYDPSVPMSGWNDPIWLLHYSGVLCDKIRYFIHPDTAQSIAFIKIYVWDPFWIEQTLVYQGAFNENVWIEKDIPDAPKLLGAVTFEFYNNNPFEEAMVCFAEADFGQNLIPVAMNHYRRLRMA